MILTLNDKKLDKIKHNKALLIKNVETGKFDIVDIAKYQNNIIPIALVKITQSGMTRTMSLYNSRQIVKKMNDSQIRKLCENAGYKLINNPERNTPFKAKPIVNAQPMENNRPMREEEISEQKFMGYQPKVVVRRNSYSSKSDKKISKNKAGELQSIIRDYNYYCGKNAILRVSAIAKKYEVVENNEIEFSANNADDLFYMVAAAIEFYAYENGSEYAIKLENRRNELQKMIDDSFAE